MPVDAESESLLTRIFEALSHPTRRCILYHLREQGQAELDELASVVVAWTENIPAEEVSPDSRKRVKVDLQHRHLPNLADNDIIEYDPRSTTARYDHPPNVLGDILDLATTIEDPPEGP